MTIYNMKLGGNDAGSGIGDGSAWATFAKAQSVMVANDILLLNCGDEFPQTFTPPAPGITLGKYGVGADPIVSGANAISGFSGGTSNIWDAPVVIQPNVVVVGVTRPRPMAASRADCTSAGAWFWSAGTLSVFATSNPSGTVKAGARNYCVDSNSQNNLKLVGVTLKHANLISGNNAGLYLHATPQNISLTSVTITECAGCGIFASGTITGLIMQNVAVTWCGSDGFSFSNGANSGFSLLDSDFSWNGWRTGLAASFGCGVVGSLVSGEIGRCTFTSNGLGSPGMTTEHGLYLSNSSATPNTLAVHHCYFSGHINGSGFKPTCGGTFTFNTFEANREGMLLGSNGTTNVHVVQHHNKYILQTANGVSEQSKGSGTYDLEVYHETFYNNGGTTGTEMKIQDLLTSFKYKNNISYASPGRATLFLVVAQNSPQIDYNEYWRSDGAPGVSNASSGKTWAQWQALGFDAHGINANPLLVGPTPNNFALQASSPAIDKGLVISGINDGFSGSAPDLGAVEFTTSTPPVLAQGQWAYDSSTGKVLVRLAGDANPNGQPMVVFDWRFGMEEILMVTTAGVLRGRLCRHFGWTTPSDASGLNGGGVSYDSSRVTFASNWGGGQKNVYTVLTDPRL